MKEDDIVKRMQDTLHELGIEDIHWKRNVTAGDVLYLLDQRPYLLMTDTALKLSEEIRPKTIITAKSGWKIHDYDTAMGSSPGELLYGPRVQPSKRSAEDEQEGGSGGVGVGTVVNQAVITAWEMVELAKEHGWTGIRLIDAHPLMAWAAWMQAIDSEITLEGYQPTAQDFSKRRRIKQSATETFIRAPRL